jgi:hypothetical protein
MLSFFSERYIDPVLLYMKRIYPDKRTADLYWHLFNETIMEHASVHTKLAVSCTAWQVFILNLGLLEASK